MNKNHSDQEGGSALPRAASPDALTDDTRAAFDALFEAPANPTPAVTGGPAWTRLLHAALDRLDPGTDYEWDASAVLAFEQRMDRATDPTAPHPITEAQAIQAVDLLAQALAHGPGDTPRYISTVLQGRYRPGQPNRGGLRATGAATSRVAPIPHPADDGQHWGTRVTSLDTGQVVNRFSVA